MLFIILCGCPPFFHRDHIELFELIKAGEYSFNAPAWEFISDEAKDLVKGLLVVNPEERLTSEEIQSHPWLNGTFEAND